MAKPKPPEARDDEENTIARESPPAQATPDVASDRVPATDAQPEGGLERVKTAALGIKEIENLEDDAKGG